jgi:hypothetical protein
MEMQTMTQPVQRLEDVKEVGALLTGDLVDAVILREGFKGKICFVEDKDFLGLGEGPYFARKNGDEIRVYSGWILSGIDNGELIIKDMCTQDYSGKSIPYFIFNRTLKIPKQ